MQERTVAEPIVTTMPVQMEVVKAVRDTIPVVELEDNARPNLCSVKREQRGTWVGEIQYSLDSLANTSIFQSTQLGIYVYDITSGCPLYASNASQRMRPASCQKLVTSISALHFLGGKYRFSTSLKLTGEIANGVLNGDVYVVGGMDPLLSSDDVSTLADELKKLNINTINGHLYLDTSMREDTPLGWGWCWDDDYGPLSALTVDGKSEFAQVWVSQLGTCGIELSNPVCEAQVTPSLARNVKTIYHTIDEVLMPMMKNSNNIYAESMFYQLAAKSGKKGAGRKQVVSYVNQLLTKLGLNAKNYQIADGSGLSLYNYVSPLMLVTLLRYAYSTASIRSHLLPSLPVSGVDGTLSKRMVDTQAFERVQAKTGTVDGISSLSGYATASNGHVLAFSIINQGIVSSSVGKDFQDKVCIVLCR